MDIVSINYSVADGSFREKVRSMAARMLRRNPIEAPVSHYFSPGLYLREIRMAAGSIVVGKIHKTEHFNILVQGACLIIHEDFTREELRAPMVFVSKPGVQKVLYILEDMIWMTTHVTEETDLIKLEDELIEPTLLEKLT